MESWQLVNLTPLSHPPGIVPNGCDSGQKKLSRSRTASVQRSYIVLRFKRCVLEKKEQAGEAGEEEAPVHLRPVPSLSIAFPQRVSFLVRLPRYLGITYEQRHANDIAQSSIGWGSVPNSSRIEYLTPLVGYTPHDHGSTPEQLQQPQKLPHVRLYFDDEETARKRYRFNSNKTGRRNFKLNNLAQEMLSKWKVPRDRQKFLEGDAFSLHHLSSPEEQFFNDVNDQLHLQHPNLCSYNSWLEIDTTRLKMVAPDRGFSCAQRDAFADGINVFRGCQNRDDVVAPMTILSFDIEQYAPMYNGKRPFPMPGNPDCFVSHIGVSIQRQTAQHTENVCLCIGRNTLTDENRHTVGNLKLRCFKTEAYLLKAFWDLLRDSDIDCLSGFNIVGYDIHVLWVRSMMLYLCQKMSYTKLKTVHKVSKSKMQEYRKLQKSDRSGWEKAQKTKELFGNTSPEYTVYSKPPPMFFALSTVPVFTPQVYNKWRQLAGAIDTENFFYISQIRCQEIVYQETNYQSQAHGSLKLKTFTEDTTQWATICAWLTLKKSLYKLKSYSLKACMQHFLPEDERQKVDMPYETMFQILELPPAAPDRTTQMGEVAVYCARDAQAPLALLEYLTTILELRLFGQLTRCTLQLQAFCGQQKKIVSKLKERLHLRQFYINEYDKPPAEGKYAGATVIEPTPGYHEQPVACLDFMSLYPSIMIEQNICFSTILRQEKHARSLKGRVNTIRTDLGDFSYCQTYKGILPELEDELLSERRAVKKMMKSATGLRKAILDKRQLSLKVLCNSVYGFCGVKSGILPLRQLAASVTARGREMIFQTQRECEKLGYEVVYGDTDSVMIKIPGTVPNAWQAALKLEHHFGEAVFLNKSIVLEAEKVYWPYLILETKKRYVGRSFEDPNSMKFKLDTKGIEMKRTDCTPLLKKLQKRVIDAIMPSQADAEISVASSQQALLEVIRSFCQDLVDDRFPVDDYVLSATAKTGYKSTLPAHMVIFNRRNKRVDNGIQQAPKYNAGDRPEYVVVYTGHKKEKVVDHVEDPLWMAQHPENIRVDRLHYFKTIRTAIKKLCTYHFPYIDRLFDACAGELERTLRRLKNIEDMWSDAATDRTLRMKDIAVSMLQRSRDKKRAQELMEKKDDEQNGGGTGGGAKKKKKKKKSKHSVNPIDLYFS
jgi:DNA polymerase elongation subunit (family B)